MNNQKLDENKINFVSEEAKEIFYLSLENESLEKENQQLKEQLQQKEDIINKAREYIENNPLYDIDVYEYSICLNGIDDEQTKKDLLEILDNKGDEK